MNPDLFDALARRFALAGAHAGTRRALLRAFGLGTGAVALRQAAVSAGPVAPETSHPARLQTDAPTLVDDLAFDLEYDVDKIFAFVAEEIRYEPYAGALRGPIGTIWAGAGNSVDKSQLLAALLEASLVQVRYVVGEADAAELRVQYDQARGRPASPMVDRVISGHLSAAYPEADPAALATPSAPSDRVAALRADLLSEAAGRVSTMAERLTATLREAGVPLFEDDIEVPDAESAQHTWVQIASGPEWVDLNPSLPTRQASNSGNVMDALPDDWFHTVTVRVSHEQAAGETLERVTSLEHTVRSQDMINGSFALLHIDSDEMTTLGFDLGAKLEGSQGFYPVILAGTEFFYGTEPMTFGGQGGVLDVFDDNVGLADGEALAGFYDIEVRSPGDEPIMANRVIFDRLADQRTRESLDLAGLEPIELTEIGAEKRQYLPLAPYRALASISGQVPARYSLLKAPFESDFNTFSDAARGTQSSRQAIAAAGNSSVASGIINRPNLVGYTYSPAADDDGALTSVQIAADLLVQSSRGAAKESEPPYGIMAGVTAQVAEETALDTRMFELMADVAEAPVLPTAMGATVGRIFAAAEEQQIGLRVITTAADLSSLSAPIAESATSLISAHIDSGRVVILPEDLVEVDGEEALGWWVYDPQTGAFFDQLADGRSGVFAEYAIKLRNIAIAAAPFLANGECMAALASAANDLLTGDTWGAAAGAVEKFGACA